MKNLSEEPLEFPILRQAIIEVIQKEKDIYKVKQIASWTLGLGGETPEMVQLQNFMIANEEYHKTSEARISDLQSSIDKFPKWLQNEKLSTVVKVGLGIGISLGVTQIPDVLALFGV